MNPKRLEWRTPAVVATAMFATLGFLVAAAAAAPSVQKQATPPNACAGAGSATHAVVDFYYALNLRQFAAAYQCLDAATQSSTPFAAWKKNFAHMIQIQLWAADDGLPNGTPVTHVGVDYHQVDRINGVMTLTAHQGAWHDNSKHQLSHPKFTKTYSRTITKLVSANPAAVFTLEKLKLLKQTAVDVTGDGIPDSVYFTAVKNCGNCLQQQLWIYSNGQLVFQQWLDNPKFIAFHNHKAMQLQTDTPGSKGIDTGHPTSRTYLTYIWSTFAFQFHSHRVATVGS